MRTLKALWRKTLSLNDRHWPRFPPNFLFLRKKRLVVHFLHRKARPLFSRCRGKGCENVRNVNEGQALLELGWYFEFSRSTINLYIKTIIFQIMHLLLLYKYSNISNFRLEYVVNFFKKEWFVWFSLFGDFQFAWNIDTWFVYLWRHYFPICQIKNKKSNQETTWLRIKERMKEWRWGGFSPDQWQASDIQHGVESFSCRKWSWPKATMGCIKHWWLPRTFFYQWNKWYNLIFRNLNKGHQ